MANKFVANSTTGPMGVYAFQRSRYEKSETSFGLIPAAAYATGDTLVFSHIPAKEFIYGRIVSSAGDTLEFFNQTDFSNAIAWGYSGGAALDLQYYIVYIRGTGAVHPGLANGANEVAGEHGVRLSVTVTIAS